MKKFEIPVYYRSAITGKIKDWRKLQDPRKKDFAPTTLDFGPVIFYLARHFGFCYGVENAIEISYKAIEENPGLNVFLLSQMIHNPDVNDDLQSRGIRFIMDTDGTQLIPWDEITKADVVIIPAFGTTIEIEGILEKKGVAVHRYNTTCPFVEKVWNRATGLGKDQYTVIIHGKPNHEETRATFSHSAVAAPSVILRDLEEAISLGKYITGEKDFKDFDREFKGRTTKGFDPRKHLDRVGAVNQTTMLAADTQAIADHFRKLMIDLHGIQNIKEHFADTRDTLCYATNDNQDSTYELLNLEVDIAIVVGGYNSSNTSHIVELCERKFPTYFISSAKEIITRDQIRSYNVHLRKSSIAKNFLPEKHPIKIILTSGASCPDTLVDEVMLRLLEFYTTSKTPMELVSLVTDSPAG